MPGVSKANAQRPPQPVWEVLAEVLAAVEVLPRAARIGRDQPLGAATPKASQEMGQLLERPPISAAYPNNCARGAGCAH